MRKKPVGPGVNQDLRHDPGTAFDAPCPRLTDQKGPHEWECEGTQPKAPNVRRHKVNDNY